MYPGGSPALTAFFPQGGCDPVQRRLAGAWQHNGMGHGTSTICQEAPPVISQVTIKISAGFQIVINAAIMTIKWHDPPLKIISSKAATPPPFFAICYLQLAPHQGLTLSPIKCKQDGRFSHCPALQNGSAIVLAGRSHSSCLHRSCTSCAARSGGLDAMPALP